MNVPETRTCEKIVAPEGVLQRCKTAFQFLRQNSGKCANCKAPAVRRTGIVMRGEVNVRMPGEHDVPALRLEIERFVVLGEMMGRLGVVA